MPTLPVVENPRGKKRRRNRPLTAAQKAAGFGGRAAKNGRKTKRRKTAKRRSSAQKSYRARRNPTLATMRNPKRRRRYRNPALPQIGGINIQDAAFVAGGIIGTKMAPGLIAKVWPEVPREGFGGMAVKAGATVLLGMATQMLTKSTARRNQVVAGGIAALLVDIWDMYAAPKLGLSGLAGYSPMVTTSALRRVAYSGSGVSGYNNEPIRRIYGASNRQQMLAA